ncbi:MAG TPA: Gfo/Idh/MocA family oxidoreductase [bacterium]|nr:Gfo/Idh/MocA family oxidoreductase [bacterium]
MEKIQYEHRSGVAVTVEAERRVGIGVIGYDGVAKAHLQAILRVATVFWPLPVRPVLVALAGRSVERLQQAAQRYGAQAVYTDWRRLIEDRRVEILVNAGPNDLHADPCIAAASRGLHVLCEKPLARSSAEAAKMWNAATRAGVVHMAGYNYRFIPAVLLARQMIVEGRLGQVRHFRARFCDDSMVDPSVPYSWRHSRAQAGSGVIGDLAAHAIDLARFLVGDVSAVSATTRVFVDRRPRPQGGEGIVDVEDAIEAVVEFAAGAVGTLDASTFCPGRKNFLTFEVNGTLGSLVFNLERLNELEVFFRGDAVNGFRTVMVTEGHHPYGGRWWPPGHIIGWEQAFVHQLHRFLAVVAGQGQIGPEGATFEDGYQCAVVCDLLARAARDGRRVDVAGFAP